MSTRTNASGWESFVPGRVAHRGPGREPQVGREGFISSPEPRLVPCIFASSENASISSKKCPDSAHEEYVIIS